MMVAIFIVVGTPDCEENPFYPVAFFSGILSAIGFSYGMQGFYYAFVVVATLAVFYVIMWSISWVINSISIMFTGKKFLYSGFELAEMKRKKGHLED